MFTVLYTPPAESIPIVEMALVVLVKRKRR